MSDYAQIVRDGIMADSGYDPDDALAALDALVAERDEALKKWGEAEQAFTDEENAREAAEAELKWLHELFFEHVGTDAANVDPKGYKLCHLNG